MGRCSCPPRVESGGHEIRASKSAARGSHRPCQFRGRRPAATASRLKAGRQWPDIVSCQGILVDRLDGDQLKSVMGALYDPSLPWGRDISRFKTNKTNNYNKRRLSAGNARSLASAAQHMHAKSSRAGAAASPTSSRTQKTSAIVCAPNSRASTSPPGAPRPACENPP